MTTDKKWKKMTNYLFTDNKELSEKYGIALSTLNKYSTPNGHKPPMFIMMVDLLWEQMPFNK